MSCLFCKAVLLKRTKLGELNRKHSFGRKEGIRITRNLLKIDFVSRSARVEVGKSKLAENIRLEVWRDFKIQPRNHIRYPRMLWHYTARFYRKKSRKNERDLRIWRASQQWWSLIAERRTCTWLSNDEFTKFINISEIWIWIRRMQHWKNFYMDS